MGMFVNTAPSFNKGKPQEMTLLEFMLNAGNKDVNDIYSKVRTGSYSGCHVAFFEATGV